MNTVNFSRYHLNLQEIRGVFFEIITRLLLYLLVGGLLYYFAVIPAINLSKRRYRIKIFQERLRFLQESLVKLETRKNYLLQYHRYFERRRFANLWQELWPFLEKFLPENAWIDSVIWEKYNNRHILLVEGGALIEGQDQNELNRKLNEMILAFPSSCLGEYLEKVKVEEIAWDRKEGIFKYVLGFYPKNI